MLRLLVLLAVAALAVLGGGLSLDGLAGLGGGDGASERARVVDVVDGDTLKVRIGGRRETVRLIGIDTPESVAPGRPVECAAKAAARALRRRALTDDGHGRSVRLVDDPTQDRYDRYDRRLAYVELVAGGTDLGEALVRDGWAAVYVYDDTPFARTGAYRRAAGSAEDERRGVHRLCGGDFHLVP